MRTARVFTAFVLALGAIAIEPAIPDYEADAAPAARTHYVSTSGSDRDEGSIARPWRTLQFGLDRLRPGDTLVIRGGTYFERPTASLRGTPAAPIMIRSYPGERVVLDSGAPEFRAAGNRDWEPVDRALGEYRSVKAFSHGNVYAYVAGVSGYENERLVLVPYTSSAAFRATSDRYVDASTPFYVGPGTFWDVRDQRIHIRLAKTDDLRFAESRYGAVFAADHPDPRQFAIILSQAEATLTVSGSYLVFKDLTIDQALKSVLLTPGAHHVVFDGVTVWLGARAIQAIGAHDLKITRSRIYGDAPYWIFWSDMKDPPAPADRLRATSIDLRSGAHDVEISYCHIRGSGQDLIGVNDNERDVAVHHNRLENAADDALELEGTVEVGRIAVFENFILNCLTVIAPGQDTPRFSGPLLVYRNVMALLRNPPVNRKEGINDWNGGLRYGYEYMFKHGTGTSYTTRNAHYYHNTLVMLGSGGKGLNLTPKDPADCRIANNIAVMVNGTVNRDFRTAAGEVVDGDLYWKMNPADRSPLLSKYQTVEAFRSATGLEAKGIGSAPGRGTDPRFTRFRIEVADRSRPVWRLASASESPRISDFLLRSDSPAVGAGITIPPHPALGALPDTRRSRDIGALPLGTSPAEYQVFPFLPEARTGVARPARAKSPGPRQVSLGSAGEARQPR